MCVYHMCCCGEVLGYMCHAWCVLQLEAPGRPADQVHQCDEGLAATLVPPGPRLGHAGIL